MNRSEILKLLQKLSEKDLTLKFLIPLYESKGMGCKNVRYTHRKLEFGKDIIYSKDNEYGTETYTGVQVKRTKITTSDIDTISRQITEAFGEPFTDSTDGKKKDLDRVVVLSSNEITEEAKDSLWASLKGARLDKLVKFVDGNQLIKLLEDHLPSAFWNEYDYFHGYFNAMKKDFETIKDISAIGQKDPIPLEQMYVSLKVSEKTREREIPLEKGRKIFDEEVIQKKKEVERPTERVNIIDVDKAVKDYRKFVIVGAPGSGKTTVLRHLALKSCKENLEKQERICTPVPIILLKFLESGKDLRDYIDVVFEEYNFPRAKEFVEKDLKEGKCMVLLDGFDELVSKENQEQVTVQIQEFVKHYHRCQIIVTSRVAGYHDELKDFMKLELMEFDDKQIRTFIKNWFGKTAPDKAESMQEAIENEHIKDIVRNPLMITITAIILEEDKELPRKRVELYERCVEVLLSKWDVQRRLKNTYAPNKKEFILRKLAFYGHSKNKRIMTEREIIREMLKHFPTLTLKEQKAKPLLNEIWQRSYLLRQISMDSYDFLHLSFQEYFTALELKEQSDGLNIISKHLSEPWWEEPTLLYAGIKNDATDLIKKIRKELPEDIFYSNLVLFGKCIIDAEHTEPSLKEEIINNLWWLYRNAEFSSLRERAIKILARIKPKNYIDLLIKELEGKNKKSGVRLNAAKALGMIGGEKAVKPLITVLATNEDGGVRGNAAEALGMIGREKAIKPLVTALATDEDGDVRWRAAEALGEIGGEKAVEPLVTVLATNEDGSVRGNAAEALGMIGREKAIKPLVIALVKDIYYHVRRNAAKALGRIGGENAIKPLVTALATDEDGGVRWSAAYALGMIGGEKAVNPLKEALKDKRAFLAEEVKEVAFDALERVCRRIGKRIPLGTSKAK